MILKHNRWMGLTILTVLLCMLFTVTASAAGSGDGQESGGII